LEACAGNWAALEANVPEHTRVHWLRRFAPGLALATALLVSAWLIPLAFGNTLKAPSLTAVRVTLIITAVTALITPSSALSGAADSVVKLGGRSGGQG
jgi:hypothetical protein